MEQQSHPHEAWARLGRYVRQRRRELGIRTQTQMEQAGGPSVATLSRIESGRSGNYSEDVIDRTERTLRWERGSWDAILHGDEPTLVTPAAAGASRSQATLDVVFSQGMGIGGYPDFVGNDAFYRHIWDFKDAPEDEREYAILRVHMRRLRRQLAADEQTTGGGGRREAGPA